MVPQIGEIFKQSKELKEIIESYNWTLYDSTTPPKTAFKWEELDSKGPAKEYIIGNNYILTPIKKENETLRKAYSLTKGFGPILTIDNENDEKWVALEIYPKISGKTEAMFSRIYFLEKNIVMFNTPKSQYMMKTDLVALYYENLIDTMRKNFKIVSPKEYGINSNIELPYGYN